MTTAQATPASDTQADEQVQVQPIAKPPVRSSSHEGAKKKVKVLPRQRIVKVLTVGMEVTGKVKRTSEFGAFVDIGVGRDGLLHISELSTKRVHKVSDLVKEGDEVTVWIKQLDRDKNRISLTMIPPGTKTIRDLSEGELVIGTIQRLTPYGAFVDIGLDRDAMLHVKEMADAYVAKPEDVVTVGEEIEARVVGVDRRRGRVDLSLKGLRPAPEEPHPNPTIEDDVDIEPISFSEQEDDVPTLMELAFREAFDGDPSYVKDRGRGRRKDKDKDKDKRRRKGYRESQGDIIGRTLRYRQERG